MEPLDMIRICINCGKCYGCKENKIGGEERYCSKECREKSDFNKCLEVELATHGLCQKCFEIKSEEVMTY